MRKDIRYVPSPPDVVEAILTLARVGPGDVFHDLGSGDGRLVIAAARRGARAIGTDIDPRLVARSQASATEAGVTAEFRVGNLFEVDLTEASVVTLYLLTNLNLALRNRLRSQLRPGSRVVSHNFAMGDWEPAEVVEFEGRLLHLWKI